MSELLKTKMEEVYTKCTAIEEGFSKNAGKQFIRTPLMIAARDGHIKCVEALIKQGADVNALDENSSTPLMRAADRGNVECIKALVTAGADPDASNIFGANALKCASSKGHVECVKSLLQGATDVNSFKLCSALFKAVERGDPEITELLIKAGVDVNESCLLDVAMEKETGRAECLRLLISSGRNQKMLLDKALFKTKDLATLKLLIEGGADVNAVDDYGGTLVMRVIQDLPFFHYFNTAPASCIKLLLSAGADVNALDYMGSRAIAKAAEHYEVRCLEILVEGGAGVNVADTSGWTPLMYPGALDFIAMLCPVEEQLNSYENVKKRVKDAHNCVKLLLRAGALINRISPKGTTPIEANIENCKKVHKILRPMFEDVQLLLCAAGEKQGWVSPPGLHRNDILNLKHLSREAIRSHLIRLDPERHLFSRIPLLELPTIIQHYLLYNVSLEIEIEEKDRDPNQDENLFGCADFPVIYACDILESISPNDNDIDEDVYRSRTVNSKSFVGKVLLRIKWKFELTVYFKHEILGQL